jgi:hypothetical protein
LTNLNNSVSISDIILWNIYIDVADETGAMVASFALMVGLDHQRMTCEGTKIDTSLLGSMIRLMGHSMTRVLFPNLELPRSRARVVGGPKTLDVSDVNLEFDEKKAYDIVDELDRLVKDIIFVNSKYQRLMNQSAVAALAGIL